MARKLRYQHCFYDLQYDVATFEATLSSQQFHDSAKDDDFANKLLTYGAEEVAGAELLVATAAEVGDTSAVGLASTDAAADVGDEPAVAAQAQTALADPLKVAVSTFGYLISFGGI